MNGDEYARLPLEVQLQTDRYCLEFEDAWRRGALSQVQAYMNQFADLQFWPLLLEIIPLDMEYRQQHGGAPMLEDYARQFPAFADRLAPAFSGRLGHKLALSARQNKAWFVHLQIIDGPHQGQSWQLQSSGTVIVGRGDDATWSLRQDESLSRYHFRIEVTPPACRLIDLASKNGSMVNGTSVQERMLVEGDVIQAGNSTIRVEIVPGRIPVT